MQYGDPILRAKGKQIEKIDDYIRALAANMIETMHAANGVGLAAQQVGEALQLAVLDISQIEDRPSGLNLNGSDVDPTTSMPLVLINPEMFELSGNYRTNRARRIYNGPCAKFGRRQNRNRCQWLAGARDSARSRSS